MKILHYENFKVASLIPTINMNDGDIVIEKNILTFTQYFGGC